MLSARQQTLISSSDLAASRSAWTERDISASAPGSSQSPDLMKSSSKALTRVSILAIPHHNTSALKTVAIARLQALYRSMRKPNLGPQNFTAAARTLGLTAAFCALASCAPAMGPPQAPLRAMSIGEGLATRLCGQCHAVASGDSALGQAPPFRVLRGSLSRADMEVVLRRRMVEVHPRMPLFRVDDDQLLQFLTYWDELEASPR